MRSIFAVHPLTIPFAKDIANLFIKVPAIEIGLVQPYFILRYSVYETLKKKDYGKVYPQEQVHIQERLV